jgi:hypothetical protein
MSTPGELKRRARLRRTARLVGAVSLGLGAVAVAVMLGMRARYRPLLDAVRRFNRAVSNPRQMQSAGTPGAYASVTRHTGRTSGRPYATPIEAATAYLSASDQRFHRWFGINQCLRVRRVEPRRGCCEVTKDWTGTAA